jgi:hypothetical protein
MTAMSRETDRAAGTAPGAFGVLGAAALVTVVVLHLAWAGEPFESSAAGTISGDLTAYSMRAWDALGWRSTGLRPCVLFQAGTPESFTPFVHHPPLAFALYYLGWRTLGAGEWSLRAVSLAALLLLAAGTAWVASGRGAPVAWTAAGLVAALPMMIAWGRMADTIVWSVACMPLAAAAWWRFMRTGGKGAAATWFGAALLAALTGWYASFLPVALAADLLLRRGRRVGLVNGLLLLATPFLLGIAAYVAWVGLAAGDPALGLQTLLWRLGIESFAPLPADWAVRPVTWVRYLEVVPGHLLQGAGPLIAVAGTAGLLGACGRALLGRAAALDRAVLVLCASALAPLVLLRERSVGHAFFVLTLAPGLALAALSCLLFVDRGLRRFRGRVATVVRVLPLAAVLLGSVLAGTGTHDAARSGRARELGAAFSRQFGSGDVLLIPAADYAAGLRYYTGPVLMNVADDPLIFEFAMQRLRPGRESVTGLHILLRRESAKDLGWALELPVAEGAPEIVVLGVGSETWLVRELDRAAILGGP